MNIEIMRNTLYKAYLDDFAAFCRRLGGATAEVMGGLLSFEVRPCTRAQPGRGSLCLGRDMRCLQTLLARQRAQDVQNECKAEPCVQGRGNCQL